MWYTMSVNEICQKLETDSDVGLSDEEVQKRQETFGKNKLNESKKKIYFQNLLMSLKTL